MPSYEGSEPFVFVSYSHDDYDLVREKVIKLLDDRGIRHWYDSGIQPSKNYDSVIADHIERCSCFVACFSKHYNTSDYCSMEIHYAADLDKPILPVYLDPIEARSLSGSIGMRFGHIQGYSIADRNFAKRFAAESHFAACAATKPQNQRASHGNDTEEHDRKLRSIEGTAIFKLASSINRDLAECGVAGAQYDLGISYLRGSGVPQDNAEAARWFRKAAEQGYVDAQYELGISYRRGRGVPRDDAEAVRWLRKAAEQGHADAKYELGL